MLLLPLLLVLSAAPPEGESAATAREQVLLYEGPEAPSTDPAAYRFTTYAPGDTPFLAVDEANLRASASIDAPVVRSLRLGSQVEVLEAVSEPTFVKDRVDRWYRVRLSEAAPLEGFVLGNVLTPLSAAIDLDGDGKEERLAVSFTSDFVARVRVLEPELAARRKRAVAALDFLLPLEAGKRGGHARLVKVPAEDFGAPVPPRAFGLELCADRCVVHAVTYEAPRGALGSLSVPPEAREGVRLLSRPRRLVTLKFESEDDYYSYTSDNVPCHVIGRVRGGQHDKKEVLSCVLFVAGKSGPDEEFATYYLVEGDKRLRRLAHGPGTVNDWWAKAWEYWGKSFDVRLESKGYHVAVDTEFRIPGLIPPRVLYADARGEIRLLRRAPERYARSAVEVAFVHPSLGPVTMTRPEPGELPEGHPLASNGFFVPEPEGGFLLYAYQRDLSKTAVTWKEPTPDTAAYTYTLERNSGCSATRFVDPAPSSVRAADLMEVGEVTGAGPLFTLRSPTHPELERAWEEWSATPAAKASGAEAYTSRESFLVSRPWLYWRDSFGRLLRVRRSDLSPPCMAEPIVYFYPEQRMRVRYTLAPSVRVARAVPLPKGNTWTFLATPQGLLEEVEPAAPGRRRRTFAHLFWEGTSLRFPPPAEGFCVPGPDLSAFFREVLPRLGLLPHETEDFVDAWAPRLEGAAFHVIGFHSRETVEALAPVELSPPPETLIRILMDATPAQECPALSPPTLPKTAPSRQGFTVVEWGGVLREGR
jgi:hypothetical protein